MTLRDKVAQMEPDRLILGWENDPKVGGVLGCPTDYTYLGIDGIFCGDSDNNCSKCWSQEYITNTSRPCKDTYYLDIALQVSKRSTCLKRKYGCVIVKNDEIIATGYNGSPRGEENCCDLGVCKRLDKPHNSGDYSDCHSVHAEQNAMLSASRRDMLGATLYLAGEGSEETDQGYEWSEIIDCTPCPICGRMIANSGISRIVNRSGEVCHA